MSKPRYEELEKRIKVLENADAVRKKAEEELKESEEKYRSLVEINTSVIYRLDNKGTITFISSRISEIIGYKSDELIGKNISEIIYKDDIDKIKHINEKRTGVRATKRLELRLTGKKGIKHIILRYVGVNADGIYENGYIGDGKIESKGEPKGAFIGTQGTITDITERIKIESYQKSTYDISKILLEEKSDKTLYTVLEKLGKETNSSRAYIFEIDWDKRAMNNTYEWINPEELKNEENPEGIEAQIENLQDLPIDSFPDWMSKLKENEIINVSNIHEYGFEKNTLDVLDRQEIKSILVVPLYYGKELHGFIGFDNCKNYREWDNAIIEYLATNTRNIASFMKRKGVEQDLNAERAQLLSIFDSIGEIIYVSDPHTYEILYVNQVLKDTFQKELLGGVCYREFQSLNAPCEFCTNDIILKQKPAPHRWEYHNPVLDKDLVIIDRIIKWPDGRDVRFEFAMDITDRRKTEEALRESEKRFRDLADSLPQIVCETDNHGKLTYVNKNAYDVFGYSEDDFNEGINAIQTLIPEDRERAKQNIMNALYGKKVGYSEYIALKKDGSTFPIMLYSSSIIKENNVVGLRVIVVDITERKRLEEQLQIRQRMDSLGTLAGGIAHDFNNILMSIMLNMGMLNMDSEGLTESQKEYLNNAMKSSERAASLIGQFQTLSRGSVVGKVSVDVYETADDVFGVLKQTTDRLIEKKIAFNKGNFYVTANPSELNQVLMNLSMNSIHAIEERGVKRGDYISIKAEDCSITGTDIIGLPEGEYVHILFEDSGTGMADEVKRKAFDPLFTTKDKGSQKGQGLGLAMVYNIVTQNHDGHITIESSEGKGTTFHIYLPKAHSEARAIPEEIMGTAGGDETVLIIEDEDTILKLVRSILEKFGYTVLTAEDGEKGLDIYKKKKDSIDLVILDLTMPEMSGQMVFEEMLKIDHKVKVIISSGHSEEDIRKGILMRTQMYLEKPYKLRELTQAVRTVLDS